MNAVVFSLGCKVNTYEGQAIISLLENIGISATDKIGAADIYIINTCSVTAEADKKSRQAVARLLKYNPDAKILVLGCSSQNDPVAYFKKANVMAVGGVGGKIEAVRLFMSDINSKMDIKIELPTEYEDNLFPSATRTRGYIKIQDGCNNFCSYCRIPYLRGRSRSRALESILSEAEMAAKTTKEIVLTGINISDYAGLKKLVALLGKINVRKRLGSLECEIIDEELLCMMRDNGFCDHFHLSLQSGSDKVLKKMNRHYTSEYYLDKCDLIYKIFPYAAITTDIITGFPGEDESDFQATKSVAKQAHFAAIHAFPYSERKGTLAYTFKQMDKKIREERAKELIALGTSLKENFIKKNLGRTLCVYAEEIRDGFSEGFTSNYIKVYSELNCGEMGEVKLVEPYLEGVKGEIL